MLKNIDATAKRFRSKGPVAIIHKDGDQYIIIYVSEMENMPNLWQSKVAAWQSKLEACQSILNVWPDLSAP